MGVAATITAILHDRLTEIAIFHDWQKPRKALMPDFYSPAFSFCFSGDGWSIMQMTL
jgi:hypothetical protein